MSDSPPIDENFDQTGEHDASAQSDSAIPNTNPATNLLIADIVLRGAGRMMRETLEKRMVTAQYDPDRARDMVDGRTILTSVALYGASKLAARSGPGLAIVAGGLLAKVLYDRGKARQLRQRGGVESAPE